MSDTPHSPLPYEQVYVWFADNGGVRKWSSKPFYRGVKCPASVLNAVNSHAQLKERVEELEKALAKCDSLAEDGSNKSSIHCLEMFDDIVEAAVNYGPRFHEIHKIARAALSTKQADG